MKAPTKRQTEALSHIREFRKETGTYPSLTGIATHFGFSRNAAWELIGSMERKGLLSKAPDGTMVLPEEERIAMENVPIPLWGDTRENMSWVPRSLEDSGELFSWHIASEDMKDAGILPGDEAVFTRDVRRLSPGEIVLSRAGDGESLFLRRWYMRPDGFTDLVPENDTIGKITTKDPEILGRLIRLIRRY